MISYKLRLLTPVGPSTAAEDTMAMLFMNFTALGAAGRDDQKFLEILGFLLFCLTVQLNLTDNFGQYSLIKVLSRKVRIEEPHTAIIKSCWGGYLLHS